MNNNILAPIVLFVYNRLDHTKKTVDALKKNLLADKSTLYIYSDGPKNQQTDQPIKILRKYLHTIDGFKNIYIIEREKNYGLAESIIDGVSTTIKKYKKVIVLEDDLVTSPFFLQYMNNALDKYKNEPNVYSITGYSYSDQDESIKDDTYFLPLTSSWSWATWDNRWEIFSRDAIQLKACLNNRDCKRDFNFNNSYPFDKLAKNQFQKKSNSWAIYWYFSVFRQKGLTLYPKIKLVKNIGHDGSGTHCNTNKVENIITHKLPSLTDNIHINPEYQKVIQKILRQDSKQNRKIAIKAFIKKFIVKHFSMYSVSKVLQFKSYSQKIFLSKNYGKNTYVDHSVQVLGLSHVAIGDNTIVSEDCWLNVNYRDPDEKHIQIGSNCYIGRRNFFSSGKQILIADYCMTGIDCKFLGSDHKFDTVMSPYISTGITSDNIIHIGYNVWLGANVTVVGDVSIGYGSIIGAGSLVTKDVPPFSVAVGSPAKVIKRFSFQKDKWVSVNSYNITEEAEIPSEQDYLDILKKKVPKILLPLQAGSKKFGDLI